MKTKKIKIKIVICSILLSTIGCTENSTKFTPAAPVNPAPEAHNTVHLSSPTIASPTTNPYYSSLLDSSLTVQGGCESNSTVKLAGDSTGSALCTGGVFSITVNQPTGPTNTFNFTLTQTDSANNTSGATIFQWIREDIPATPTIAVPATSPLQNNLDTFQISGGCTDGNTVTLAGADSQSAVCSASSFQFNVTKNSDETYNFSVTQVNKSNQVSAAGNTQWIRDTSAPAAPTIVRPGLSPYLSEASSFNIAGACEPNATVNLSIGGSLKDSALCSELGIYIFPVTVADDGDYQYSLEQTDLANNKSSAALFIYTRDTSIPSTPVITLPSLASVSTNQDSLNINGSCTSGLLVTLAGDDSQTQSCSNANAFEFIVSKVSAAGSVNSYSFTIMQTSETGINSGAANQNWQQDKLAPDQLNISNPASPSVESSGNTFDISGGCETGAQVNLVGDDTQTLTCASALFSFSISKSQDGIYNFSLNQTDAAGNNSPSTDLQWKRNSIAPAAPAILNPATAIHYSNTNSLNLNGTCDSGNTVNLSGDLGTQNIACDVSGNFSFSLSSSSDGSYQISVSQTKVGLTSGSNSMTWVLDRIAPETNLTSQPSALYTNSTAIVQFNSNEVATFECQLDAGSYSACVSGISFNSLTDGSHTVSVRAIDQAGNVDPTPATASFTVDTTAPETTITSAPATLITLSTASVNFDSSESPSTFECQLDFEPFAPCVSGISFNSLTDGSHTVSVRAIDQAGNVDATPATANFTVDTAAPDTTITSAPEANSSQTTASVNFVSSESPSTFECQLNSGAWTICAPGVSFSNLADGSHTIAVRAIDQAGNVDATPATANFVVDAIAPETTITSAPATLITVNTASVNFNSSESPSTFECQLDSGAWTICASGVSFSNLADGSHIISVRAIDQVGNVDASPATASFTVDTAAPDTTITSAPAAKISQKTASVNFDSSESPSTFECQLDSGAWTICASGVSFSNLADGSHTISVRAIDQAGYVDATPAVASFTVDTVAPNTTITSSIPLHTTATTASVNFTSSESPSTFECKLDLGAWTICTSGVSYSGLSESAHAISVRAIDEAGNIDATPSTATFTVNTVAPVITFTSTPPSIINSLNAAFSWTTDHFGTTYRCKMDVDAFPGNDQRESYSTCPAYKSYYYMNKGNRTFSVEATNPAGGLVTVKEYTWKIY